MTSLPIYKKIQKATAWVTASCVFTTQCLFASTPQSNFWAERRRQIQLADAAAAAPGEILRGLAPVAPAHFSSALSDQFRESLPEGAEKNYADLFAALPYQYGQVRKIIVGGPQVVVHIQDVHMNAEAQENISKTLQSLIESKQAGLVALEGAFGPLDMQRFRKFAFQDSVRSAADYLLRRNEISGAMHAALTHAVPSVIGVDDPAHYSANVESYRQTRQLISSTKNKLTALTDKTDGEKEIVFNPELLEFDGEAQSYHRGKMSLGDFMKSVRRRSAIKSESADVFLQTLAVEKNIDFAEVEKERAAVVDQLVQRLSSTDVRSLAVLSAAYRSGTLRYADFYGRLRDMCRSHGVSLSEFPAMETYIRYVLAADRIQPEELLKDLSAMEADAYRALARTPTEKALAARSKYLGLAEKLVDFSLTPEEWKEYSAIRNPTSEIDLSPFESFYREAEFRDVTMAENLLKDISEHNAKVTVLVTGGFHSDGIAEKLRRAGVTYINFTPKITRADTSGGSAYLSVFSREKTPLEKMFEGEKLFLSPLQYPPAVQSRIAIITAAIAAFVHRNVSTAKGLVLPDQTIAVSADGDTESVDLKVADGKSVRTIVYFGRGGISNDRMVAQGPVMGFGRFSFGLNFAERYRQAVSDGRDSDAKVISFVQGFFIEDGIMRIALQYGLLTLAIVPMLSAGSPISPVLNVLVTLLVAAAYSAVFASPVIHPDILRGLHPTAQRAAFQDRMELFALSLAPFGVSFVVSQMVGVNPLFAYLAQALYHGINNVLAYDGEGVLGMASRKAAILFKSNSLIDSRFQVLRVLSESLMSLIYLCEDTYAHRIGARVAVKMAALSKNEIVHGTLSSEGSRNIEAIINEHQILRFLQHPRIPSVVAPIVGPDTDTPSDQGDVYLPLNYVEGDNLEGLINEAKTRSERLHSGDDIPAPRLYGRQGFLLAVKIFLELAELLPQIHLRRPQAPNGVIHRDIKPANILVDANGNPTLMDFGLAVRYAPGRFVDNPGTEGYAPTEQYEGRPTPWSDYYSLGATASHLFTQVNPRFEVPDSFDKRPITRDVIRARFGDEVADFLSKDTLRELDEVIAQLTNHDVAVRSRAAKGLIFRMKQIFIEAEYQLDWELDSPLLDAPFKKAAGRLGRLAPLYGEAQTGPTAKPTTLNSIGAGLAMTAMAGSMASHAMVPISGIILVGVLAYFYAAQSRGAIINSRLVQKFPSLARDALDKFLIPGAIISRLNQLSGKTKVLFSAVPLILSLLVVRIIDLGQAMTAISLAMTAVQANKGFANNEPKTFQWTVSPPRYEPGTLIGSELEVISRIGKTGISEVYRAQYVGNAGKQVAVKIALGGSNEPFNNSTIANEHGILTRLRHPQIVSAVGVGRHDGYSYLVMELIEGETLKKLIDDLPSVNSPLYGPNGFLFALGIMLDLAILLADIHQHGILYRDMTPANIMVNGTAISLLDFGIAFDQRVPGAKQMRAGTEGYIPPEQYNAKNTPLSDVYGWGAVASHLFTGYETDSDFNQSFRVSTPDREMLRDLFGDEVGLFLPDSVIESLVAIIQKATEYMSSSRMSLSEIIEALTSVLREAEAALAPNAVPRRTGGGEQNFNSIGAGLAMTAMAGSAAPHTWLWGAIGLFSFVIFYRLFRAAKFRLAEHNYKTISGERIAFLYSLFQGLLLSPDAPSTKAIQAGLEGLSAAEFMALMLFARRENPSMIVDLFVVCDPVASVRIFYPYLRYREDGHDNFQTPLETWLGKGVRFSQMEFFPYGRNIQWHRSFAWLTHDFLKVYKKISEGENPLTQLVRMTLGAFFLAVSGVPVAVLPTPLNPPVERTHDGYAYATYQTNPDLRSTARVPGVDVRRNIEHSIDIAHAEFNMGVYRPLLPAMHSANPSDRVLWQNGPEPNMPDAKLLGNFRLLSLGNRFPRRRPGKINPYGLVHHDNNYGSDGNPADLEDIRAGQGPWLPISPARRAGQTAFEFLWIGMRSYAQNDGVVAEALRRNNIEPLVAALVTMMNYFWESYLGEPCPLATRRIIRAQLRSYLADTGNHWVLDDKHPMPLSIYLGDYYQIWNVAALFAKAVYDHHPEKDLHWEDVSGRNTRRMVQAFNDLRRVRARRLLVGEDLYAELGRGYAALAQAEAAENLRQPAWPLFSTYAASIDSPLSQFLFRKFAPLYRRLTGNALTQKRWAELGMAWIVEMNDALWAMFADQRKPNSFSMRHAREGETLSSPIMQERRAGIRWMRNVTFASSVFASGLAGIIFHFNNMPMRETITLMSLILVYSFVLVSAFSHLAHNLRHPNAPLALRGYSRRRLKTALFAFGQRSTLLDGDFETLREMLQDSIIDQKDDLGNDVVTLKTEEEKKAALFTVLMSMDDHYGAKDRRALNSLIAGLENNRLKEFWDALIKNEPVKIIDLLLACDPEMIGDVFSSYAELSLTRATNFQDGLEIWLAKRIRFQSMAHFPFRAKMNWGRSFAWRSNGAWQVYKRIKDDEEPYQEMYRMTLGGLLLAAAGSDPEALPVALNPSWGRAKAGYRYRTKQRAPHVRITDKMEHVDIREVFRRAVDNAASLFFMGAWMSFVPATHNKRVYKPARNGEPAQAWDRVLWQNGVLPNYKSIFNNFKLLSPNDKNLQRAGPQGSISGTLDLRRFANFYGLNGDVADVEEIKWGQGPWFPISPARRAGQMAFEFLWMGMYSFAQNDPKIAEAVRERDFEPLIEALVKMMDDFWHSFLGEACPVKDKIRAELQTYLENENNHWVIDDSITAPEEMFLRDYYPIWNVAWLFANEVYHHKSEKERYWREHEFQNLKRLLQVIDDLYYENNQKPLVVSEELYREVQKRYAALAADSDAVSNGHFAEAQQPRRQSRAWDQPVVVHSIAWPVAAVWAAFTSQSLLIGALVAAPFVLWSIPAFRRFLAGIVKSWHLGSAAAAILLGANSSPASAINADLTMAELSGSAPASLHLDGLNDRLMPLLAFSRDEPNQDLFFRLAIRWEAFKRHQPKSMDFMRANLLNYAAGDEAHVALSDRIRQTVQLAQEQKEIPVSVTAIPDQANAENIFDEVIRGHSADGKFQGYGVLIAETPEQESYLSKRAENFAGALIVLKGGKDIFADAAQLRISGVDELMFLRQAAALQAIPKENCLWELVVPESLDPVFDGLRGDSPLQNALMLWIKKVEGILRAVPMRIDDYKDLRKLLYLATQA